MNSFTIESADQRIQFGSTEDNGMALGWEFSPWFVGVYYGAGERPSVIIRNCETGEQWTLETQKQHTPENITSLADDEIFVFGSNTAGRHGAGAAKLAHDKFGAEYGVGEGPTGQCYALPTLDDNLQRRALVDLAFSLERFVGYAAGHPEKRFLLTRIGTGLAGYPEATIKSLVMSARLPKNVIKPKGW